jgi:hypothetical protein
MREIIYQENSGAKERDISGRPTAILQFSSEMQQTWHSYYWRPQKLITGLKIKKKKFLGPFWGL